MRDYKKYSDQELFILLGHSDHDAFTEIYHRYKGLLYIHALKLLKDEDEVLDVIHELFTVLWENRFHLNLNIPLRAYLYKAVKNRIFDIFSHQKINTKYQDKFHHILEKGQCSTEEQLLEKELIKAIEAGLALLPVKMRQVFEMSRFQNLSHKEIAAELNISDKTVKTQVHNALAILKLKINSLLSFL